MGNSLLGILSFLYSLQMTIRTRMLWCTFLITVLRKAQQWDHAIKLGVGCIESCRLNNLENRLSCILVNKSINQQKNHTHRKWRNQAGFHLEASLLLASFHSAAKCCECYQEGKHAYLSSLKSILTTGLEWHYDLCNSDKNVEGVNSYFLAEFKSHSKRWNTCLITLTRQKSQLASIQAIGKNLIFC